MKRPAVKNSAARQKWLLAAGIILILTGCSSSSQSVSDEEPLPGEEISAVGDADTDAPPAASPELGGSEPPSSAQDIPAAPADVSDPAASAQAATPEVPSDPQLPPAQASAGNTTHTVRSGDTLMKISFEYFGDLFKWREIYESNRSKINDPNRLVEGTQLEIASSGPASIDRQGDRYTIRRGDTLGTISNEVYGTPKKWKKIYENNRQLIHDPNRIFAGFDLYYVMSPEDREEVDRLKNNAPAPLANSTAAPVAPLPGSGG